MKTIQLVSVGDGVGFVLPAEFVRALKVKAGDELCATEMPDGLLLSPLSSEVADQLRVGREIMSERHAVLRALAR